MNSRRARPAMTLLEVVVALAVAGAALAAGASVLGFLTDQQARTGGEVQSVASAHAIRSALREWTSQALLATQGDAEFRGVTSSGNSELDFVTGAATQLGMTGTRVRIFVEHDANAPVRGLVAELRPWRSDSASTMLSLAPDATGLHVRYLASIYGAPQWTDRWVSTSILPAAMEVRVEFNAPGARTHIAGDALLGIPMTITLGVRR